MRLHDMESTATTHANWAQRASQVEQIQLRLLYAAIFEVFGKKQFETDPTTRLLQFVNQSDLAKVNAAKRWPPLKQVTSCLSKSLRKVDIRKAAEVYEWMLKDNPDKLLLRLIRQEVDSSRVATALGKTITWYIKTKTLQKAYTMGEEWLLTNVECNVFLHNPPRYIAGEDNVGRPLVYVKGDQYPFFFSKRGIELWGAYFSEQVSLLTQDHTDGATFIYDVTGFPDSANIETSVIKFINETFGSHYPGQVARMIIHNAPKIFENGTWKVYSPMLSSRIRHKVVFTYRTQELLEYIPLDQLPKTLGGFSLFKYEWIDPPSSKSREPAPKELITRKQSLIDQLDALTIKWVLALYDRDHFKDLRSELLSEWAKLYWEMDKYDRPQSIVDRNGIAAKLRPESIGQAGRELSFDGDDELSAAATDIGSIYTGYELHSVETGRSKYAASVSSSTRKVLGFLKRLGRPMSLASQDNASIKSFRDTASVQGH